MKIWAALRSAGLGWLMLLRGEPGWRAHFALTAPGLATALVIFACTTFIAVAIASLGIGAASLVGIVAAMLALALPLAAMLVVLLGTRSAMHSTEPVLDVLVPATYALIAFMLVEGLLALLGPAVMLAWLGLAFLLYRLARAATTWNVAISAGFAVLTVVLLVAMRMALYMVSCAGVPT